MAQRVYTTQLQAGLGMVHETKALLSLWQDGMTIPALQQLALESGQFPTMTARRLRNIVAECFGPRYLKSNNSARYLKQLVNVFTGREVDQVLFVYTCRANAILYDFVIDVYWSAYSSGRETISNDDSLAFIVRANDDGKTTKRWSPSTVRRVASYLTGACEDFGLLGQGSKSVRKLLPFRIEPRVAGFLAHELHFSGLGDNSVLAHCDWSLFGMSEFDALEEVRRLALRSWVVVQTAGDVTRISWVYKSMEEWIDALAQS